MGKSHYDVLGIDNSASSEEVKAAYRREAKRLHPDHYEGDEGSAPFRAVREAYEVLCDPQQRCAYDDELDHRCARRVPASSPWRPSDGHPHPSHGRPPVEPLIPEAHATSRYGWSPFPSGHSEEQAPAQGRQSAQTVHVNALLSPAQVRSGGAARLILPVRTRCPDCEGRGYDLFYTCPVCLGQGSVAQQLMLNIALPSGLRDGETLRISLIEAGLPGVDLVMHCYWA